MLFDVVVTDERTLENRVFRNGINKRDAKKMMKELRQKGFKVQLVTCKGKEDEASLDIPENEMEE